MEQHPVPRNITGFQFKLFGNMTVKQFGYLFAGTILGIIFIKIPFPLYLNFILGITFISTGVAFAFIPIHERPLDIWFTAFIKSVLSPTQFIWRKNNPAPAVLLTNRGTKIQTLNQLKKKHLQNYHDSRKKLKDYLASLPKDTHQVLDEEEQQQIKAALNLFNANDIPTKPQMSAIQPQKTSLSSPQTVYQSSREKKLPVTQKNTKPSPSKYTPSAKQQISNSKDPKKTVRKKHPVQIKADTSMVRIITPDKAKQAGFPSVTENPNIICGLIKDRNNALLANILVTIKDKQQTPVRALKTNKLGHFSSSTPLANGVYFIECEDPQKKYNFVIIEITLTGSIVPPMEITAKSKEEIKRENLIKQIFGKHAVKK